MIGWSGCIRRRGCVVAGPDDHAEALIALDEITGPATMEKAVPALNTAKAAAGDAAGAAAGEALLPTVAELQVSAQDLVRRMVVAK